MAKQKGALLLGGKTGGLVFYTNRYGNIVQTLGEIPKERYKNDPSMARRRETAEEFGYSAMVGRLLRLSVKQTCALAEIGSTHNKLSGIIMRATQKDTANIRGERRIMNDNVRMLQGFNWRKDEPVRLSIRTRYEVELDVAAGSASLNIGELVPERDVTLGEGATHVQIMLVLAAVDDVKRGQVNARAVSGLIAVDEGNAVNVSLNCSLDGAGERLWIAGIGVQGYQEVNGQMLALRSGGGFEIVKAAVG